MIRSTAIVIYISLALCTVTYGQEEVQNAASVLADKLSDSVDIQALNATATEQVENLKNKLKSKCEKNAGPGQYEKVLTANNELQSCVKGLVNVTELQDEIEKAKPTGDLDIVFKKYCMKKTTLKKCTSDFISVLNPCLESAERESTKIVQNVTDSLLNFICHKEGDRIALFIASGGPECFQAKQQEIQDCLNSTYGGYFSDVTNTLSPSLETLPALIFGVKECNDMQKFRECAVRELEKCDDPTPGNIADSLLKFIKRVTPCESMLNARSDALVEEPPTSSAPTIFTMNSFIFLVASFAFTYI
ncbi:27 kDa hemolymph protein-like [Chelonus insularis]|uniref:27 kDa hemolymph protein-like n=1 Tax=Chelonus insularis TaxID=460826 RepID=UPI00158B555B|nr:27 kDa hemolymph protein-like [Chelonus insularis]